MIRRPSHNDFRDLINHLIDEKELKLFIIEDNTNKINQYLVELKEGLLSKYKYKYNKSFVKRLVYDVVGMETYLQPHYLENPFHVKVDLFESAKDRLNTLLRYLDDAEPARLEHDKQEKAILLSSTDGYLPPRSPDYDDVSDN